MKSWLMQCLPTFSVGFTKCLLFSLTCLCAHLMFLEITIGERTYQSQISLSVKDDMSPSCKDTSAMSTITYTKQSISVASDPAFWRQSSITQMVNWIQNHFRVKRDLAAGVSFQNNSGGHCCAPFGAGSDHVGLAAGPIQGLGAAGMGNFSPMASAGIGPRLTTCLVQVQAPVAASFPAETRGQ